MHFRFREFVEENKGRIKAADIIQKYHGDRLGKLQHVESVNKKKLAETEKRPGNKDAKVSENHKSQLANFRSA